MNNTSLNLNSGTLIARLAPIKEDSHFKKLGPGSYDPVKPGSNMIQGAGGSWAKQKDKRTLWYENRQAYKLIKI